MNCHTFDTQRLALTVDAGVMKIRNALVGVAVFLVAMVMFAQGSDLWTLAGVVTLVALAWAVHDDSSAKAIRTINR